MKPFALLISARADAAFFAQVQDVAVSEINGIPGVTEVHTRTVGGMVFVMARAPDAILQTLRRLSFVHGVFEVTDAGFVPCDAYDGFALHPDFVWGEKYRGKTNETLTQLMINVGLQTLDKTSEGLRLLDPMCGRGTSLLWGLRYGMHCVGIEQDGSVLNEVRRGLKKWSKLHRQKHTLSDGWIQKANKQGVGKYLEFAVGRAAMRIVIGDSRAAYDLTLRKPFDLIVTDIPYGVQHMGGSAGARSPLDVMQDCAPAWKRCLAPGGVMVIAFNANLPKRAQLEAAFASDDLDLVETRFAHRMSESIMRDLLVLKRRV